MTAGWSGGGPHALACAAALKGRCRAAATLAGIAPLGAPGLDFLDGMGAENIAEFGAAIKGEKALAEWMEKDGSAYRTITAGSLFAAFGSLLPPVDQKALTSELVEVLAGTIRSSLKNGFGGWMDDDLAFVSPWGFRLDEISAPGVVWQGNLDKMVPLAHGRWLVKNLPGCRAQIVPAEGHISLVAGREKEIISGLLEIANRS